MTGRSSFYKSILSALFSALENKNLNIPVVVLANNNTIETYIEEINDFDVETHHEVRHIGIRGYLWGTTVKAENSIDDCVVIVVGSHGDTLSVDMRNPPVKVEIA